MYRDLTKGNITKALLLFALPMIAGNLLQQFYNIADTMIVGRFLGSGALAAVGSSYSLMTFLTSVFIGLSMGSGALFSICIGSKEDHKLKRSVYHAFLLITSVTIVLNILVYAFLPGILAFLQVPADVYEGMKLYLLIIFAGIPASSLYNFIAALLRAAGNSSVPLYFLAVSAGLNIVLDLLFVVVFHMGIAGAAAATIIAQYVSAAGILIYLLTKGRSLLPERKHMHFEPVILKDIMNLSFLTCLQQSVMNFGILCVQGLVNSFGTMIMAAFAAGVKIDSFAYLPVQDFGNAYSTFIAQNYGAGNHERIRQGKKNAFLVSILYAGIVSALIFLCAPSLMRIFINASDTAVIAEGARYLRIEGAFYPLIGILFLHYGHFRAIRRPAVSLVLTIISLGTRVLLAYVLSAWIGVIGIWMSIPIGWALADIAGFLYMYKDRSLDSLS